MRIIKFRAWDNLNGVMMTCEPPWSIPGIWDDPNTYLMQFTGLLDKNGKEIYEGDICKKSLTQAGAKNGSQYRIVKWFKSSKTVGFGNNENCEVIGNIYENPELLTSTQNERSN